MNRLFHFLAVCATLIFTAVLFWGFPFHVNGVTQPEILASTGMAGQQTGLSNSDPRESLDISETLTFTTYLPIVAANAGYVNPFGIIMYSNINDNQGLQQMTQAGSTIVTTMLHWYAVEPTAPVGGNHSYIWSTYDAKFSAANGAGMDTFLLFTGNPSWAAEYVGGPLYPGRLNDLKAFLSAAVERYDGDGIDDAPGSPVVTYWSFYAEPDNGDISRALAGKGYWGHYGASYATLLKEVYPVIKAANPKAQVLIGGLAYTWFEDQGGPFVREFLPTILSTMKTSYGRYYIDGLAFHYYPLSVEHTSISAKANAIKEVLANYGLQHLPIMSPETGYWSATSLGSSEEIQAGRLVYMYARGLSEGLKFMSWYKVFDGATPHDEVGLFRGQDLNSPKPAYYAYKTIASELDQHIFMRTFSASGVEGYVFYRHGWGEKTILWATGSPRVASFSEAQVRVVDMLGNQTIIADGSGNDRNAQAGIIGVYVTASPIYVMRYP